MMDTSHLRDIETKILALLEDLRSAGGLPLLLIAVAVVPAICEEILCRGPVLAGLRRSVGPTAAVVLSGLLFAALHQSPYRFIPQAALGMVLALLTLRTGTVVPAIIVHALHNGTLVVIES